MSCTSSAPLARPPPRCRAITAALMEHAARWFVRFICLSCHISHSLHISHAHWLPVTHSTLTPSTCNHLYTHTHLTLPSLLPPPHIHTSPTSRVPRPTCPLFQTGPPGKTPHMGRERHFTPTPDQFRLKVSRSNVSRAVTRNDGPCITGRTAALNSVQVMPVLRRNVSWVSAGY